VKFIFLLFSTVTQIGVNLFLCASSTFLLHLITLISHLPFRPEEVVEWKRNISDSYTICYLSMLRTQTVFFSVKLEVINCKEMTIVLFCFVFFH